MEKRLMKGLLENRSNFNEFKDSGDEAVSLLLIDVERAIEGTSLTEAEQRVMNVRYSKNGNHSLTTEEAFAQALGISRRRLHQLSRRIVDKVYEVYNGEEEEMAS